MQIPTSTSSVPPCTDCPGSPRLDKYESCTLAHSSSLISLLNPTRRTRQANNDTIFVSCYTNTHRTDTQHTSILSIHPQKRTKKNPTLKISSNLQANSHQYLCTAPANCYQLLSTYLWGTYNNHSNQTPVSILIGSALLLHILTLVHPIAIDLTCLTYIDSYHTYPGISLSSSSSLLLDSSTLGT